MNEIKLFNNPDFGQMRTVTIDGTPWLVGKDVAEALGYSNASKAVMVHVDEEDKRFEMLSEYKAKLTHEKKEKGKTKVHTGKAKTWRLSLEDLQAICSSLTVEQRQYADAVQQFL